MSVTIRRAEPADAEAIIALIDALGAFVQDPPTRLTPDDIRRDGFGLDAWFQCFLAELDGKAVGAKFYDEVREMTLKGEALAPLASEAE